MNFKTKNQVEYNDEAKRYITVSGVVQKRRGSDILEMKNYTVVPCDESSSYNLIKDKIPKQYKVFNDNRTLCVKDFDQIKLGGNWGSSD